MSEVGKCEVIGVYKVDEDGFADRLVDLEGYGTPLDYISETEPPSPKQKEIIKLIEETLHIKARRIKTRKDAWIFINDYYNEAKSKQLEERNKDNN